MRNRLSKLLMLMVSLAPVSVVALGLGELNLKSYLSQPMAAEIELVGVQPGDAELLEARLASSETHQKAGLERPFSLSALKFSVQERAGGLPYVLMTTPSAVKEPFFYFLLELSSPDGRVLREYTVLLDPPPQAASPAVAASKIEVPRVVRTQAGGEQLKMPTAALADTSQYGPTEIGDTLWEIALQVRPKGVSVNQAMIGIVRANPHAFINGNINQMLAGKVLTLPSDEGYQVLDGKEAGEEFARQQQAWMDFKATAPTIAPPLVIADTGAGQVVRETAPDTGESTPATNAGRVRLLGDNGNSGSVGAAKSGVASANDITGHIQLLEESLDVRERENQGLRDQVSDLEKQLATLRQMLELAQTSVASAAELSLEIIDEQPGIVGDSAADAGDPALAAGTNLGIDEQLDETSVIAGADEKRPPTDEIVEVEVEPTSVDEVAPAASVDVERPRPKSTSPAPVRTESGWLDLLMGNWVYLAGLVLVVALAVVGFAVRGGQKSKSSSVNEFDINEEDETLVRTPADEAEVEEAASEATQVVSVDAQEDTASFLDDFAPTVGASAEAELEDVDPIAEADVFIAYGHHEQAEEIILDAIQYDDRAVLKLKLLDIYFGQEKAEEYEQYAEEIRSLLDGEAWDRVAALGHGLNANSELFSGSSLTVEEVGSLVATSSVEDELDLGGEMDDEQTAQVDAAVDSFDLGDLGDLGDDADENLDDEQAEATSDMGGSELSTSIDLEDYSGESPEETSASEEDAAEGLEVDFSLDSDSVDEVESSDVSGVEDVDDSEDESTIDFNSLDVGDEDASPGISIAPTNDLDEDAGLDFEMESGGDDLAADDEVDMVLEVSMEDDAGLDFDMGSGTADTGSDLDSLEIEVSPIKEGGQDDDNGLEFELTDLDPVGTVADNNGDGVESNAGGEDIGLEFEIEEAESSSLDNETTLEIGGADDEPLTLDDETDDIGLDETVISFSVDDEVDSETVQNLDAVASQLDLLAAYVDMGDAEQAAALNDQIQAHGDDEQKRQAEELVKKLDD